MEKNKVTLHRVLTAAPEKVFRAFSDPDAMTSWLPPYGFVCKVHDFDFREGGRFRMSFMNFTTGSAHSFGGEYKNIVTNESLTYSDRFDDPNLPGEMITTVRLTAVSCGTSIDIEQSGIPDMIPSEMCYLGWQESLEKLKKLVEPHIPDAGV